MSFPKAIKRNSVLLAAGILAVLLAFGAVAVAAYRLTRTYTNIGVGDFYTLGDGSSAYVLGVNAGTVNTTSAKGYAFDLIVQGATVDGATAVYTAGDTSVYEMPAGTTSVALSMTDGSTAYNAAIVKHSDRNVYVGSVDDFHALTVYDAVFRNPAFDNDGSTAPTETPVGDEGDVIRQDEISYNLKEVYFIGNLTPAESATVKLLVPVNLHRLWYSANANLTLELHNAYTGVCRVYDDCATGSFDGMVLKNYSTCSVEGYTPTAVADYEATVLADALAYAGAVLPEAVYLSTALPESYQNVAIAYTVGNAAFDGLDLPSAGIHAVNATVTLTHDDNTETTGTAAKNVLFCATPNDFLAYSLQNYTNDLSLFIRLSRTHGIGVTMTLEENGPVEFLADPEDVVTADNTVSYEITADGVPGQVLTPATVLCDGAEIYYKLTCTYAGETYTDTTWRAMTAHTGFSLIPETGKTAVLTRYLDDFYMSKNADTDIPVKALTHHDTPAGGNLYYYGTAPICYSTREIVNMNYTGFVSGTETHTGAVEVVDLLYDRDNGRFTATTAFSTTTYQSNMYYFYRFELVLAAEEAGGENQSLSDELKWHRIYFPVEGLIGGDQQGFEGVTFDISSTYLEPFAIDPTDPNLYLRPVISKINGSEPTGTDIMENDRKVGVDYGVCKLNYSEKVTATDNEKLTDAFHFTVNWSNAVTLSGDITVELDIYLYGAGNGEYAPLLAAGYVDPVPKKYTITIPAVYSAADFGAGVSTAEVDGVTVATMDKDGLWLYLNVLQKLCDSNDDPSKYIIGYSEQNTVETAAAGVTGGGYIRKSAVQSITALDVTLQAHSTATPPAEPDNLAKAIAYFIKASGLTAGAVSFDSNVDTGLLQNENQTVKATYLADFSGLSKLANLENLITDGLNLSGSNLTALGSLLRLETLSMDGCGGVVIGVGGQADLGALIKLTTANLDGNALTGLDGLPASLETLTLSGNTATLSLDGIGRLYRLKTLDISTANIYDFAPLTGLSRLEKIYLYGNTDTPTSCSEWVLVHLRNHLELLKKHENGNGIFNADRTNPFDIGERTTGENGIWKTPYTMFEDYYKLYTDANSLFFLNTYEDAAGWTAEVTAVNAKYGTVFRITGYTYTVSNDVGYMDMTVKAVTDNISTTKRFTIKVTGLSNNSVWSENP